MSVLILFANTSDQIRAAMIWANESIGFWGVLERIAHATSRSHRATRPAMTHDNDNQRAQRARCPIKESMRQRAQSDATPCKALAANAATQSGRAHFHVSITSCQKSLFRCRRRSPLRSPLSIVTRHLNAARGEIVFHHALAIIQIKANQMEMIELQWK